MEEKYREVATVFLLLHSLLLAYHRIIILDLFLFFFSFEVVVLVVVSLSFLKKKMRCTNGHLVLHYSSGDSSSDIYNVDNMLCWSSHYSLNSCKFRIWNEELLYYLMAVVTTSWWWSVPFEWLNFVDTGAFWTAGFRISVDEEVLRCLGLLSASAKVFALMAQPPG